MFMNIIISGKLILSDWFVITSRSNAHFTLVITSIFLSTLVVWWTICLWSNYKSRPSSVNVNETPLFKSRNQHLRELLIFYLYVEKSEFHLVKLCSYLPFWSSLRNENKLSQRLEPLLHVQSATNSWYMIPHSLQSCK